MRRIHVAAVSAVREQGFCPALFAFAAAWIGTWIQMVGQLSRLSQTNPHVIRRLNLALS